MRTPPFGLTRAPERAVQLAELKNEVRERLKNVCADWPHEDFEKLIDDIAATSQKYLTEESHEPA